MNDLENRAPRPPRAPLTPEEQAQLDKRLDIIAVDLIDTIEHLEDMAPWMPPRSKRN